MSQIIMHNGPTFLASSVRVYEVAAAPRTGGGALRWEHGPAGRGQGGKERTGHRNLVLKEITTFHKVEEGAGPKTNYFHTGTAINKSA